MRYKYSLLIFLFVFSINSIAQNKAELDSLVNLFAAVRGVESMIVPDLPIDGEQNLKCGLHLVNTLSANFSSLSIDQQLLLKPLLQRPTTTNSLITPSGKFKIHYIPTGNDAPGYDLNQLAQSIDSVYRFYTEFLGYAMPPGDSTYNPDVSSQQYGGDNKYDIYVLNLGSGGSGLYGYTQFEVETEPGKNKFTSYMVIDNDYSGYYSSGIKGAQVTVAHEFHHSIQGGNYIFRPEDTYFYEITSTAFEEFIYDSVNDYYAYMNDYFRSPSRGLSLNNGYNIAIWNIFLKERFGYEIIKRQWELMPTSFSALKAIATSLNDFQTSLGNELNKFGIWCYFTNSRSILGNYFEEASSYPLLSPTANVFLNAGSETYNMTISPTANYFLNINLPSNDGTFLTIVTNSDYQKAFENPSQSLSFSFSIFSDTLSGNQVLDNKYSVSHNKENQLFWNNAGILNNVVVYGDSFSVTPKLNGESFSYPSPFKYASYSQINIAFASDGGGSPDLDFNVYSSSMGLVYSKKMMINKKYSIDGKQFSEFSWDARNEDGDKLSSGVYVYAIKYDDTVKKGKLVIFNE